VVSEQDISAAEFNDQRFKVPGTDLALDLDDLLQLSSVQGRLFIVSPASVYYRGKICNLPCSTVCLGRGTTSSTSPSRQGTILPPGGKSVNEVISWMENKRHETIAWPMG
jgi:hypothetical protein